MLLSTPRTRILERASENNEGLRTTVSLRCWNAVLEMQTPSHVVLPFVYAVIRVVVAAVVCFTEMYDRNLVASRMYIL